LTISRLALFLLVVGVSATVGCGKGSKKSSQNTEFFTSGSREADQRASQRMAKSEELAGSGENAGEKGGKKKAVPVSSSGAGTSPGGTNKVLKVEGKAALFNRLGSEAGISNIVADFTPRVLDDPRVNWARQFLAPATGGPAHYEGKDIKSTHAGLHISNPEFDAALGDLKASLDRLQIPNQEQKELLAIIESTRPEIVEER
jgi:hemoglobin